MHIRERIRNEAVAAIGALTTTGGNVFEEVFFSLEQAELPGWIVFTGDEAIETVSIAMGSEPIQERALELIFEGSARGTSGVAMKRLLEDMLEELEGAIIKSAFTDLEALDLSTVEIEPADLEQPADQAIGTIVVTYVATYITTKGAASAV